MREEVFKDVVGYEGTYEVSNLGRVKSLPKLKRNFDIILKASPTNRGYPMVGLFKDGLNRPITVHKLMQKAFSLGDGCIDHIDGDTMNNNLDNLRVVSHRENSQNAKRHRKGKLVGAYLKESTKYKLKKPWSSQIYINGKIKRLGYFATEREASDRYFEEAGKINK